LERGAVRAVRESEARAAGLPVLPIFSSSARSRRTLRKLLYYSINNAQESIYLTTAYFIPSRRMLHVLEAAVSRGVDVRLLLPGISDVSAAYYAGRAFFSRLLRAGIEIHTFSGSSSTPRPLSSIPNGRSLVLQISISSHCAGMMKVMSVSWTGVSVNR